jgi:hypothetical protein
MNIQIELSVAGIKAALPGLSKIIPRSSSLPVLQCVKISLDPDQAVQLRATNLDEFVSVQVGQCTSDLPGELLIPYDELVTLSKNATGLLRMVGTENETKVCYTLAGQPVERLCAHYELKDWPAMDQPASEPLVLDEHFKLALREALECASSDRHQWRLPGCHQQGSPLRCGH